MKKFLVLSALGVLSGTAMGQFVNGDFSAGNFSGWTITPTANGRTAVQQVVNHDIDFGGPLGTSLVGQFSVGQVTFVSGQQEGIELTQMLSLTGGVAYTFEFDWSAHRASTTGGNSQGGVFSLIAGGNVLASGAAGSTSSTTPKSGHLMGVFTPTTSGMYSVGARITRPFTVPTDLFQSVDNFTMNPVPEPATLAVLGLGAAAMLRRRRK